MIQGYACAQSLFEDHVLVKKAVATMSQGTIHLTLGCFVRSQKSFFRH